MYFFVGIEFASRKLRCFLCPMLDWMRYFRPNSTQNDTASGREELGSGKVLDNPRGNKTVYTVVSDGWLDVSETAGCIDIRQRQECYAVRFRILQITFVIDPSSNHFTSHAHNFIFGNC